MRVKSTCLNDIIETAILFLYLPIQPNSSFPSVVQHPFTNAPISALNVDGSMRMLDLMKPNDLQLWQKEMEKKLCKITDPMLLLSRVSKGYRLAFIKYVNDYLSIEDLSKLLRFAWRSVEFPNRDPNFSHSQLCQLFKECSKELLMHKEELAAYNKLPKTVHIYRGVTSGKKRILCRCHGPRITTSPYGLPSVLVKRDLYARRISPKKISWPIGILTMKQK